MKPNKGIKVLFVCTGNICRSPMAEAVFKQLVKEAGLEDSFVIGSAGTASYHIGERPHIGTRQILKEKNVPLDPVKTAMRVDKNSIQKEDYIIALDAGHARAMNGSGKVHRLLEFASHTQLLDVPDPYYEDNFEEVYELILDGCQGLLEYIREQEGI